MTFGKRLISQELTDNFFEECEKEGVTLSGMRKYLEGLKEHEDEIDAANRRSYTKIRERIKQYSNCPRCEGKLLFDESNEHKYCPVCE
jgi:hypothetical protein